MGTEDRRNLPLEGQRMRQGANNAKHIAETDNLKDGLEKGTCDRLKGRWAKRSKTSLCSLFFSLCLNSLFVRGPASVLWFHKRHAGFIFKGGFVVRFYRKEQWVPPSFFRVGPFFVLLA